jgi:hypothetical protein
MKAGGVDVRFVTFFFLLAMALPASGQDQSYRIFTTFTGRYHCNGLWRDIQLSFSPVTGPYGIEDPSGTINGGFTFFFNRSVTSRGGATYRLRGPYDRRTGRFHLEPVEWYGPHPATFEMIGIEGTFEQQSQQITAKMLNDKCDAVEFAAPGKPLPRLPPESASQPAQATKSDRPERQVRPINVTNYLDVAAGNPDFQYLFSRSFDPPGTVHEAEPIEESIEAMKNDKFVCVGSHRVTWDGTGTKGSSPDQVGVTDRYVIECVGKCESVFYRPWIGAKVTHFALSQPLPTFQITSVWFGGTRFEWHFSRSSPTGTPPDIYVHRWVSLAGYGPFDPTRAEQRQQMAAAPPCRAPKTR